MFQCKKIQKLEGFGQEYDSGSCGGLGLENRLLVCQVKRTNVNRNENDFGMKEDRKPGYIRKMEFSWMELLRLMI